MKRSECEYCDVEFLVTFVSKKRMQRFCSSECRNASWYAHRAAKVSTGAARCHGRSIRIKLNPADNCNVAASLSGFGIPFDIVSKFVELTRKKDNQVL